MHLVKACLTVLREKPDARHWMDPLIDSVSHKPSSVCFLKIQSFLVRIAASKIRPAQKSFPKTSLGEFSAIFALVIGRDSTSEIKEFRVGILHPAASCAGGQ